MFSANSLSVFSTCLADATGAMLVAMQPLLSFAEKPQPGPLELLITYLPMVLIVIVAWVLLYRPERERMRLQKELLLSLKKNDRVVTGSGIYGTVANVERDTDRVTLKVDDAGTMKITVTLSSIAKVLNDSSEVATSSPS